MDEDVITDLKQFITATVSQQLAGVATKDDLKNLATKDDVAELRTEMNQRFSEVQSSIGEALSTSNDAVGTQLEDHEQRLVKLESKTA
jgi:hypothetical protein